MNISQSLQSRLRRVISAKTREGDFLETCDDLIFDVKGLVHPPTSVIAFVRYFPYEKGKRRRKGTSYGKVYSFSERYKLLKERFPRYLVYNPVLDETLCEVPVENITRHYEPTEKLQQLRSSRDLDALEGKALKLATSLKEKAGVPWKALGVSGSILVGLHGANSDIDPAVYGSESCWKVHSALRSLLHDEHSPFRSYNTEDLTTLFDFRSKDTAMSFQDFVRSESRKVWQGKFVETDYFVRFVKGWSEVDENYGDVQYKKVGYARIKAKIADDSEAIFTPCTYEIENVATIEGSTRQQIVKIVSFRGRFCEQARTGETVIAQGKVERVIDINRGCDYLRLLIGGNSSDFMVLRRHD